MKDFSKLLQQLTDLELLDCCESLAAVEAKQEGMYLGEMVTKLRAEVGDTQFYDFEAYLNAECRRRWYQEHKA